LPGPGRSWAASGDHRERPRRGYSKVRPIAVEELYRREPHLGPGALGALEVPDEFIVCPWTRRSPYATEALRAGVEVRLGEEVTDSNVGPTIAGAWRPPGGGLTARWLVNAAGLFAPTRSTD